jgi:hypothetical protein
MQPLEQQRTDITPLIEYIIIVTILAAVVGEGCFNCNGSNANSTPPLPFMASPLTDAWSAILVTVFSISKCYPICPTGTGDVLENFCYSLSTQKWLICRINDSQSFPHDCWLLIVDCWLLIVDCWLLIVDCWLLIVDCWLLIVDCWLLIVDCWLLIVDCW